MVRFAVPHFVSGISGYRLKISKIIAAAVGAAG